MILFYFIFKCDILFPLPRTMFDILQYSLFSTQARKRPPPAPLFGIEPAPRKRAAEHVW